MDSEGAGPGNIAMIGGTGFEDLPPDIYAEPVSVSTDYGEAWLLSISNNYVEPYKLYFMSRHGSDHSLGPHQINYRANIQALQKLEVRHIIASNAVGALRPGLQPGDFVLMDDFIDFTSARPRTLSDSGDGWRHTDFSAPYSKPLRCAVQRAAADLGLAVHASCTYLCVDGPRFETPAEVRMFASWGADVVGMTGIPEAVFAREAGMNYAAIGVITNLASGLSGAGVSHDDVVDIMRARAPILRELMLNACAAIHPR